MFFFEIMRGLIYICIVLFPFICSGQETDSTLKELLLLPVDIDAQKHLSNDHHAATVVRIERAQIEKLPVQTLNELLEYTIGLDVRQRGPMDVQADLSLRGSTFDQVLIMLNGHPLNDPQTGHHNMDLPIGLDDVAAVEILYGGASLKYGPYAFAGAVNFLSKTPLNANEISAEVQGGQFGHQFFRLGLRKGNEYSGISLQLQRSASDGYTENSDFEQYVARFEYDLFLTPRKDVQFTLEAGFNSKDFGAQNFYTTRFPTQFEATRTAFLGASFKTPKNIFIETSGRFFARRHWDRFELFRETGGPYIYGQEFFYSASDTISWYTQHNYHRTDVLGGDIQGQNSNALGTTEMGLDLRYERILSNALGDSLSQPRAADFSSRASYFLSGSRRNLGLYARHIFELNDFLPIVPKAGIRYNFNTAFGSVWLPSAQLEYPLEGETENKISLSWSKAFRLPTYTDLYYRLGGAVGSIDLKPEYSSNFELSWRHLSKDKSLDIRAAAFRREGQNLIDWIILPEDSNNLLRAANVTQLNVNGLELMVGKRNIQVREAHTTWTSIGAGVHYMFSDSDTFAFESLYTLDYLRLKAYAHLELKLFKRLSLSLQYCFQQRDGEYVVPEMKHSDAVVKAFEPVQLIDARLQWTHNHGRLYLDANNLLNKAYMDRGNVLQPGLWMRLGASWCL